MFINIVFCCKTFNKYEFLGTALIIIAVIIMILDPKAKRVGEVVDYTINEQCILVNIPGALMWLTSNKL